MLIGLMSLKNQVVYIQFHPVVSKLFKILSIGPYINHP